MITTGIIRQINLSSSGYQFNKYLVELNIFQTAGDTNKKRYTQEANCCIPSGLYQPYAIGDIVYVSFINNEYTYPVILGKIYKGMDDDVRTYAHLDSLSVENTVELPKTTSIGDLNYSQIENAVQQMYSLQLQVDQLKDFNVLNSYPTGSVSQENVDSLAADIQYKHSIVIENLVYNYVKMQSTSCVYQVTDYDVDTAQVQTKFAIITMDNSDMTTPVSISIVTPT